MFVSFMCCLFWALEYGILAGAFVQILFILYQAARPKMTVQHELVNFELCFFLSTAEFL